MRADTLRDYYFSHPFSPSRSTVSLVETRKLILENAGHRVFTATSVPEVVSHWKQYNFDVAVIGQTEVISRQRCHRSTREARLGFDDE